MKWRKPEGGDSKLGQKILSPQGKEITRIQIGGMECRIKSEPLVLQ
jgi:hypothetical protein